MNKSPSDLKFSMPLYTISEAATALGVPCSTFHTWVKGYERNRQNRTPVKGDPIVTSIKTKKRGPSIPFVGLAEGMVLAAIRRGGVPMQRIRPAILQLAEEIGVEHALASKNLFTDGAELLYDYARRNPGEESDTIRELVVVRNQQRVFVPVVAEYLKRVEYGSDGYAKLIRLPGYDGADVIADPNRAFGQPIFTRGAAPVRIVLERFWAGETIDTLTNEFGIPPMEIEDVLRAASRQAA
ncbi:MAG TPA: hypothetical protein VIJ86_12100 [Acidimicrobiales bacterium]